MWKSATRTKQRKSHGCMSSCAVHWNFHLWNSHRTKLLMPVSMGFLLLYLCTAVAIAVAGIFSLMLLLLLTLSLVYVFYIHMPCHAIMMMMIAPSLSLSHCLLRIFDSVTCISRPKYIEQCTKKTAPTSSHMHTSIRDWNRRGDEKKSRHCVKLMLKTYHRQTFSQLLNETKFIKM